MRDRHSRRHNNWKKDNNSGNRKERREELARPSKPAFRPSTQFVSQDQVRQEDSAISEYKTENRPLCSYCGEAIYDMSSTARNKGTRAGGAGCCWSGGGLAVVWVCMVSLTRKGG